MKFIKTSSKKKPKVSLILLDWSVRESFHICHYLSKQTIPQDVFEVNVIEYYNEISQPVKEFETQIDHWLLLEMPRDCYYHKHLMYNIGALISKGDILVICDSDAMVKPTFIESILKTFEKKENIVLHLDQFRNLRKDLYPFNYPSFSEVLDQGCFNYDAGLTKGITAETDVIHQRNYGACFCCKKKDFLAIGGADEHIDFIGHICGPYDLTFRLINLGREEVWHRREFLYHTWHPGTDGWGEYLGPHDGYNMSLTSLEVFSTKRTEPHVINPLIEKLKKGQTLTQEVILKEGITKENLKISKLSFLKNSKQMKEYAFKTYKLLMCYNFLIKKSKGKYFVYSNSQKAQEASSFLFTSSSWKKIKQFVKRHHQSSFTQNKYVFFIILAFNKTWKRYLCCYFDQILRAGKRVFHFFSKQKREGSYIDRMSSFHMYWWNYINKAYAENVPSFFIVNQNYSLNNLQQLLQLKKHLSFKKKNHVSVILLKNHLKAKPIHRIIKDPQSHIYLLQESTLDWEKHVTLNYPNITII